MCACFQISSLPDLLAKNSFQKCSQHLSFLNDKAELTFKNQLKKGSSTMKYLYCLLYTIIKSTSKIPDTAFEQPIHFVTMSTQWVAGVSKNLVTIFSTLGGIKTYKKRVDDPDQCIFVRSV